MNESSSESHIECQRPNVDSFKRLVLLYLAYICFYLSIINIIIIIIN